MSIQAKVGSAIAVFAFAVTGSALAQSNPASEVAGIIHGEDGSAVAGASVTIQSPQHVGWARTVATDSKGGFAFPQLAPGDYTISVERTRYLPLTQARLRHEAGAALSVDVTMLADVGFDQGLTVYPSDDDPRNRYNLDLPRGFGRGAGTSTGAFGCPLSVNRRTDVIKTVVRPTTMLETHQTPFRH